MFKIQYWILFILLPICHCFILLDLPAKSNLLKYNGDQTSPHRSKNRYYTLQNSSTASLIDFMRTLYEQEKSNDKPLDYNLIRALAPRIGKREVYEFNVCQIRFKIKQKKPPDIESAFRHIWSMIINRERDDINQTTRHVHFHPQFKVTCKPGVKLIAQRKSCLMIKTF